MIHIFHGHHVCVVIICLQGNKVHVNYLSITSQQKQSAQMRDVLVQNFFHLIIQKMLNFVCQVPLFHHGFAFELSANCEWFFSNHLLSPLLDALHSSNHTKWFWHVIGPSLAFFFFSQGKYGFCNIYLHSWWCVILLWFPWLGFESWFMAWVVGVTREVESKQ